MNIQLTLDECLVDDQLRAFFAKTSPFPSFDLPLHRLEVPLHPVHANCEDVREIQVLRVFRENGCEIAVKRHVVADQNSVPDGQGEAHRFVVGISDSNGKTTAIKSGFEVEDAKHFHAVTRNRVFLSHDRDLAEA